MIRLSLPPHFEKLRNSGIETIDLVTIEDFLVIFGNNN